MNKTSIEWVKNPDGSQGYTWNPITGCLNGCPYCYAKKLANGRLRSRYLQNLNIALPHENPKEAFDDPFYPRFWPERLDDSGLYADEPRGIFVCDMGELFGDWIPTDWQAQIFFEMRTSPQHRFYLLTKQPQNLAKFSPFPPNCWVGFTATDNVMFNHGLAYLYEVEATVKFASLEPLLGRIEPLGIGSSILDWLIIGAQTKPYKPPQWEWVSEIIDACVDAGIPYFLKDNLERVVPKVFGGDGKLIQEMPK